MIHDAFALDAEIVVTPPYMVVQVTALLRGNPRPPVPLEGSIVTLSIIVLIDRKSKGPQLPATLTFKSRIATALTTDH